MQSFICVLHQSPTRESNCRIIEFRRRTKIGSCPAFTLVEFLVTLAIVAILIGLLLPAVNAIRGASRRTACQNNIRQLALATLSYEAAHMQFPTGQVGPSDVNRDGRLDFSENQMVGHLWFLLPFLEQKPLAESFELGTLNMDVGGPIWYLNEENFETSNVLVRTLRCPSDSENGANLLRISRFKIEGIGPAITSIPVENSYEGWVNYLGSRGEDEQDSREPSGIFFQRSRVRSSEIVDGLSNTICFGELIGGVHGEKIKMIASRASIFSSGVDTTKLFSQVEISEDSMVTTIFSSFHKSGELVNFAYSDGHVTGITSSIDRSVMSAFFSKDGQD